MRHEVDHEQLVSPDMLDWYPDVAEWRLLLGVGDQVTRAVVTHIVDRIYDEIRERIRGDDTSLFLPVTQAAGVVENMMVFIR
jgi:hypothetical protein